jgi:MFS family permease
MRILDSELGRGAPILGAGLLVNVIFSIPPYVSGIFMTPLHGEFGWSRTDVSIGVTILTLGMAAGGLFAGRLMRHWDIRGLIACGILAYSMSFLVLSKIGSSLGVYWFISGAMTFLGAMASPMTVSRLVADHFVQRRGFAIGFTMVGSGVAAAIAPLTLVPIVHEYGWRTGYQALAGFSLLVLPVTMALLFKAGRTTVGQDMDRALDLMPRHEAPKFGILLFAVIFISLAVGGAVIHIVPMLTDAGMSRGQVASLAGMIGVTIVASRLAVGAIVDRFAANVVAVVVMAIACAGFLFVCFGGWLGLLFAPFVVGAGLGAELDLAAYFASRLFPRSIYGSRFGLLFCAFQVGLAISPAIYAVIHTQFGNYRPAFLLSALLFGASAFLFSRLPNVAPAGKRLADIPAAACLLPVPRAAMER